MKIEDLGKYENVIEYLKKKKKAGQTANMKEILKDLNINKKFYNPIRRGLETDERIKFHVKKKLQPHTEFEYVGE